MLNWLVEEKGIAPVTSWRDAAVLGVIALEHQASSTFNGEVEDLDSTYAMSRSIAYLIRAVGIMAKQENVSDLIANADFDKSLPNVRQEADKAASRGLPTCEPIR